MDLAPGVVFSHSVNEERPASRAPLDVTVAYLLSEAGRKASLVAGGNGRALQEVTIQVSRSRLHLVSVDPRGMARLKLRPRFEMDVQRQRVSLINEPPEYDAIPSAEQLLADAARNHELARRFHDEQEEAAGQRVRAELAIKTQLAKEFLATPSRRAVPYPAPTRKQCQLQLDGSRRRLQFDVSTDTGQLAEVPPEAHRRFRADLDGRRERAKQLQSEQRTLHEQKVAQVGEWIAEHGTEDQRARQLLGVLPFDEAIEAMASRLLAGLEQFPRYQRDGVSRLQAVLADHPAYATTSVSREQLVVTSADASRVSREQWEQMERMRALVPEGFTVTLRTHRISLRDAPRAPAVTVFSVLVVGRVGLITMRRDYSVAS